MATSAASVPAAGQKVANYHAPPVFFPYPPAANKNASGTHVHILRCLTSSIHLGFHLFPHIVRTLLVGVSDKEPSPTSTSSTFVLITDTNIAKLFLKDFEDEFRRGIEALPSNSTSSGKPKPRLLTYIIPPGESSKNRETKAAIEDWMLEQKVTRDATVIALGGGVIGDLVGFVAATFMRGVKVVQIPTTLLAMVDSSVGGKTAIDTPAGKNLIGSFHQPSFIFIDASLLETLPQREFSNGMAEVVKTAAIWDADDFEKLEARAVEIRSAVLDAPQRKVKLAALAQGKDISQAAREAGLTSEGRTLADRSVAQTLLLDVIRGSVGVKAHIVTIDEKETGLRNLVNFGHSIGHAIEAVLTPDILHGECVSIGMILEAELSRRLHGLPQVVIGRLTRCLKEYNLPVRTDDPRIQQVIDSAPNGSKDLTVERLLDIMRVDKKNSGNEKKIVLLSKIGGTVEDKASTVADPIIRRVLADAAKVIPVSSPDALSQPKSVTLTTPGSKSISNRALVLAALAKGTCALKNLLHSDDTQVMMAGLQDLKAAQFEWRDGGDTIVVHGNGGALSRPAGGKEIYLQNAGTAARFMATVCTLVKDADEEKPVIITGNKRMKERPIGPLVDALTANGTSIKYREGQGCLPLAISSQGKGLKGGKIQLAASISSQYVSSILLCAPYAEQEITLELTGGQVISQLYIDMTIAMMASFDIQVERLKDSAGQLLDSYRIPKGHYVAPAVYAIESDASSATYPLALAAITGTECTVESIGSSSLQGDARFAKEVLEPMGCVVEQSATSTKVKGPPIGRLRQVGVVDMEPMTDAFLTASVLLAVAVGPSADGKASTRITGIANQRVKECNRIKAMMDELAKFGVETKEHEDGLEIFGKAITSLKEQVSVHCYDDHRVAMAFSVLASVAPGSGTVLKEKRCVEKTWPNWWDDLERKLGVKVEGFDLPLSKTRAPTLVPLTKLNNHMTAPNYPPNATIFCIGMRGTGKTYIGKHAAAALKRPFLDADAIFDERHGLKGFVAQHGWPEFRRIERLLLEELMETKAEGHLISLGGGIVETPECVEMLRQWAEKRGPVIYVKRDIEEIVAFLETSDRPAYGESVRDVWARRQPRFYDCSSYEFVNYTKGARQEQEWSEDVAVLPAWPHEKISIRPQPDLLEEVRRFSRFIVGLDDNRISADRLKSGNTHMLCLTFPDITAAIPLLERITIGADVIELRVDLLNPSGQAPTTPFVPPVEYVSQQLAALRCNTALPIIFTVRTHSQGGMFPDDDEDAYFDLVKLGIRSGCEYVDLEARWSHAKMQACVAAKGKSHIITSWHDWSGNMRWDSAQTFEKAKELIRFGDIAKIIGKATDQYDNIALEVFKRRVSALPNAKPLLAINMGGLGQMSRILNPVLTPITHPALPSKAAPGQLSFTEIARARYLIGQVSAKQYKLFGTPIAHSLSPIIHNTAFKIMGLPHRYELFETAAVDDRIRTVIRQPDFGGASVTMPHKLAIMDELDEITEDARLIGAVNTIIPVRRNQNSDEVTLVGDNTDWVAIRSLTRRYLKSPAAGSSTRTPNGSSAGTSRSRTAEEDGLTALIIGAGGSARAAIYAMHKFGARKILLFNRTYANAVALAEQIPAAEWGVQVIDSFSGFSDGTLPLPRVVVSNIPTDKTGFSMSRQGHFFHLTRTIHVSGDFLSHPQGGVIIEMSYKPIMTPLLQFVRALNADHREVAKTYADKWESIPGVAVVMEQGCEQFSLWTGGLGAPRMHIEKAARDAIESSGIAPPSYASMFRASNANR